MTTYARNVNNQAVDVITTDPATTFHADIAAQFIVVSDGTKTGATWNGSTWTNPAPAIPVTVPFVYAPIAAGAFYNCFTTAEMIAIKASTDPFVKEFYARYQVALQVNEPINPNLVSVQEGLAYLAAPASPGVGAGILGSTARITQILSGIPQ